MCGIFGYIDDRGDIDGQQAVQTFVEALRHRGPDSYGYERTDDALIGMVRLAIVDTTSGRQPFINETGDIITVVNGEIYNFQEHKDQLIARGHRFTTASDCEVVVHLYEEHGPAFIHLLQGMYAIAVYDKRDRKLSLYRDRFGKKPIYYRNDRVFAFSSEIKGLVNLEPRRGAMNLRGVANYLTFRYVLGEETIFEGIHKLPHGSYLIYDSRRGTTNIRRYWHPQYNEVHNYDEEYVAERILELFGQAVRKRLVSDVPIGVLLSGGIDSSAIVAVMSEMVDYPIKTFTLGYEDDFPNKQEDVEAARRIARQFGCEHTEHIMSCDELLADMDDVLGAFDQPFGMAFSTYFVCKAVKQAGIRVLMNGDGGDEHFAAYLAHRLANPIHNYLALTAAGLDINDANRHALAPYEDRVDYIRGLAEPDLRWRLKLFPLSGEARRDLFSDEVNDALGEYDPLAWYARTWLDSGTTDDPLNRVLETEMNTFLADNLLYLTDRLSMAHSIETRCPFLDYDFTRFASTLPGSLRMKNGVTKYIQKKAFQRILPDDIIHRRKEGFILPTNEWLAGALKDRAYEVLCTDNLRRHGLFRPETVRRYLDEHYSGRADHGYSLWNLIVFQYWHATQVERSAIGSVAGDLCVGRGVA